MKQLLWACTALGLLLTSCSATMTVRGTAPATENAGSCAARVLLPLPAGHAMMMHFAWSGASSGEDSMATVRGAAFTFTRNVPSGNYSIRSWASDAGGASCDTVITRSFTSAPSTPTITP